MTWQPLTLTLFRSIHTDLVASIDTPGQRVAWLAWHIARGHTPTQAAAFRSPSVDLLLAYQAATHALAALIREGSAHTGQMALLAGGRSRTRK
jgi:hypothetical protein